LCAINSQVARVDFHLIITYFILTTKVSLIYHAQCRLVVLIEPRSYGKVLLFIKIA